MNNGPTALTPDIWASLGLMALGVLAILAVNRVAIQASYPDSEETP
jgi:hypothetical protein